jgi:TRAP transporter TAXI family solute receptor
MKSHPITESDVNESAASTPVGSQSAGSLGRPAQRFGRRREWILLLIAVAFLGLGLWIGSPWTVQRVVRLRMAAGDVQGARYQIAATLADHLRKYRLELEVIPSAGSEESLDWVDAGEIDLALVQGGLELGARSQVRQVASLQVEALHVLIARELEEKGLTALGGKRVFLGAGSSGTHVLASNLLEFVGLRIIEEDRYLNYTDLLQAPMDALPDAIFHVSMVPSPVADQLVEQKGYRLAEVPYARAFARSRTNLQNLHRTVVSECTIPAYTYGVSPDVPSRDLVTVGSRMLLVTQNKQPNETVQRVLSSLFDSRHIRHGWMDWDPKALELPAEYELHPGVDQYRNRNKALIASDVIDYMDNLLAILATLVGALFFLYQWHVEHQRSQREGRFAEFMTRVIAIEQLTLHSEVASKLDLAKLIRMQRELANLKAEAVQGLAAGQWHGTHMLNGLLALINDTREQITRLILHERENLEQSAETRHVDLDTLWRAEAMGEEDE